MSSVFFFFNDTATTEIYTLSLHDALPISLISRGGGDRNESPLRRAFSSLLAARHPEHRLRSLHEHDRARREPHRSEEHTSELQSPDHLVCRLLLEKKKNR